MKRLNFLQVITLITLVICMLVSTSCADYNNKDAGVSQYEAPETEAPETKAPENEAPVTEAPVTEAPETEAPVTEVPVTEAPAIEASETKPEFAVDTVAEPVVVETAAEAANLPPPEIDWSGYVDRYPNDWEFLGVEMHGDKDVTEDIISEVERLIEGLSPTMRSLLRVVYLAVVYIPGEDAHEFAYSSDNAVFIVDSSNMDMLSSYFYHEVGHQVYDRYKPDPQIWEVENFCQTFDLYMRGIKVSSMTDFITSIVEIEAP